MKITEKQFIEFYSININIDKKYLKKTEEYIENMKNKYCLTLAQETEITDLCNKANKLQFQAAWRTDTDKEAFENAMLAITYYQKILQIIGIME